MQSQCLHAPSRSHTPQAVGNKEGGLWWTSSSHTCWEKRVKKCSLTINTNPVDAFSTHITPHMRAHLLCRIPHRLPPLARTLVNRLSVVWVFSRVSDAFERGGVV
jgi:hypothetical protein